MLIAYEDIGMHCCLRHRYYHCLRGLVVNQQNHVLDCCVCCFLMFRMAIIVDRHFLCGLLVNLWRFMVVFGTVLVILYETGCTFLCYGRKWSFLCWHGGCQKFLSHWCQWSHCLLELAVKTLVWLLVLVFPYHNKDSTTFCMGVWSVLQLFGLELNYLGLGSKLYLFGFWAQHFKNQTPLPTQH